MGSPVKPPIYFRTFRENGTHKPVKSWAVTGFPVIPTEKSGQMGGGVFNCTNNTAKLRNLNKFFKKIKSLIYKISI